MNFNENFLTDYLGLTHFIVEFWGVLVLLPDLHSLLTTYLLEHQVLSFSQIIKAPKSSPNRLFFLPYESHGSHFQTNQIFSSKFSLSLEVIQHKTVLILQFSLIFLLNSRTIKIVQWCLPVEVCVWCSEATAIHFVMRPTTVCLIHCVCVYLLALLSWDVPKNWKKKHFEKWCAQFQAINPRLDWIFTLSMWPMNFCILCKCTKRLWIPCCTWPSSIAAHNSGNDV